MQGVVDDFGNAVFELGQSTAKKFVRDVIKGIPQTAKGQIIGSQQKGSEEAVGQSVSGKKLDPVTGKPPPSPKILSQLTQATAQLAQAKLKRVREELEKQRLKITGENQVKSSQPGQGPEIPPEKPKPKDDVIAKTLKSSKSTGEFGKNIGG